MAYSPNLQALILSGSTPNNTTASVVTVVGMGPGFSVRYTGSLGTVVDNTSIVDVNGASSMNLQIGVTTTGTFRIEGTSDGINWGIPEVFDGTNDLWVSSGSITPTLGNTYNILASNYRRVRLRTNATLGATVPHAWTLSMAQPILAGVDTGPAPHNFGYTLWHKDIVTTTATGALFLPATAGKRIAVTDLTITAGGTTAGVVTIYEAAAAGTIYTQNTSPAIFRGEFAPSTTSRPGVVKTFNVPYTSNTIGGVLMVSSSAAINPLYVQMNGYYI
jgi:hypothetical protein